MKNNIRLAVRMSHIIPFEVMEIQSHARQLDAEGPPVLHMEVGEPDFPTPGQIVDTVITPGKDFGINMHEKHIRLAYTQPIVRLQMVIERIADLNKGSLRSG
ncbi:MAG: hypothetical protein WCL29_05200 [Pseudomonadota bacterium]